MKKSLELGCANMYRTDPNEYEQYGVDITDKHPGFNRDNFKLADLALESIPFKSNMFDLVRADDFMEHIPSVLYLKDKEDQYMKRNCLIMLFNEIYRVLKNNGEFYMQSPCYPNQTVFQDPTHVSYWTTESANYFSGDYYGFHDGYGHTSRFEKVDVHVNHIGHICITLKAIKDLPKDHPYLLQYTI